MGFNGIDEGPTQRPNFELSPHILATLREERRVRLVASFGLERVNDTVAHPPTEHQVEDLTWQIEDICTSPGATLGRGTYCRTLISGSRTLEAAIHAIWNPSSTMGGFGLSPEWDGATASVSNIVYDHRWGRLPGRPFPTKNLIQEGLFIDRYSSQPMISRSVSQWGCVDHVTKLASASEVSHVSKLLDRLATLNAASRSDVESPALPVFAEIGYGLDPAAIRGKRAFAHKIYIGFDPARGTYENSIGDYTEAVRTKTSEFAHNTDQRTYYAYATAAQLPLPDQSVREVYMANLLNAPDSTIDRRSALAEAHRVLDRYGNLIVRANWHTDVWSVEVMRTLLKSNNFHPFRCVDGDDIEYRKLDAQYGRQSQIPAPDGYYMLAEPNR